MSYFRKEEGVLGILANPKVIENMWRKKAFLEAGDPRADEIVIYVLILGGAQLGAYATGQGIALHDLGLLSGIRRIYGISTGMWVAGYLAAGEIRKGAEIYCSDFPRMQFVRWWPPRRFLLDKSAIEGAAQFGDNRLTMDASVASPIELCAGVTLGNGRGAFIDAKSAKPSPWAAFYASSANPLAYREPVEVNGAKCWDGAMGVKRPMRDICQNARPRPTDLLVLPNVPNISRRKLSGKIRERIFCEIAMRSYVPTHVRQLIYERKQSFVEDLLTVMYDVHGVNVHVLWPPDCGIGEFTMDERKLRRAVSESTCYTMKVFEQYG